MDYIKLNIESRPKRELLLPLIITTIFFIVLCVSTFKNSFSPDFLFALFFLGAIMCIFYWQAFLKNEYLAYILIDKTQIQFVYKILNNITGITAIPKKDIGEFFLKANFKHVSSGKSSKLVSKYQFIINSHEGKKLFPNIPIVAPYDFIYKILKSSFYIPNFKLEINSNDETIKTRIDYFRRYGKEMSFLTQLKTQPSLIIPFIIVLIAAFIMFKNLLSPLF